jgi:hypothetical protein
LGKLSGWKVQACILADHGLTSAVALPPLIPVAFLSDAAAAAGVLAVVERAAQAPWRIQTAGLAWERGCLYFAVSSGGLWASLREAVLPLEAARDEGLFPVFEGFHSGCVDAAPGLRPMIRPTVPDLSFSSGTLALIALRSPRGVDGWWHEVTWEIVDQRPLRGRREA